MHTKKSELEIKQLQQMLSSRKGLHYYSWGEFLEQFAINIADTLDSISGSGLLARGETITIVVGFFLRALSSILKLSLVYVTDEENYTLDTVFAALESLAVFTLAFLTIILDMLIAAITGVLLAIYFLLKEIKHVTELLHGLFTVRAFNKWLDTIIHHGSEDPALFEGEEHQAFIEQLFFRQIIMGRILCREPDPALQLQYEVIQKITAQMKAPESVDKLLSLYSNLNKNFEALEACIKDWHIQAEETLIVQIQQLQQDTINGNEEIQALFASYQHYNLALDAQENEMMLNFANASIGFHMSVAGLALALLAFLMCLSLTPVLSPVISIAPLVLGIIMITLALTYLISDCVFNKQEEQHLELEILKKANSGKFSTIIYEDMPKPMNSPTFF